jgi:hypothetical protein
LVVAELDARVKNFIKFFSKVKSQFPSAFTSAHLLHQNPGLEGESEGCAKALAVRRRSTAQLRTEWARY